MPAELQPTPGLVRASDFGLGDTDFLVRYDLIREDVGREVWLSAEVAEALTAANNEVERASSRMMNVFGAFAEPLALVAMAGVRSAQQQATLSMVGRTIPPWRGNTIFHDISMEEEARQKLWEGMRLTQCVLEDWHTSPNVVDVGVVGAESRTWADTSLCYSAMGNVLLRGNYQTTSRSLAAASLAERFLLSNGFSHNKQKNCWHWTLKLPT